MSYEPITNRIENSESSTSEQLNPKTKFYRSEKEVSPDPVDNSHVFRKVGLPKVSVDNSESGMREVNINLRYRTDSITSDNSCTSCSKIELKKDNVHVYKSTNDASEVSFTISGRSKTPNNQRNIKNKRSGKKAKLGELSEVEEVYENFSQLWDHTILAFMFFIKTLVKGLQVSLIFILNRCVDLVNLVWILLLLLGTTILWAIMLVVEKIAAKGKSHNPFKNLAS